MATLFDGGLLASFSWIFTFLFVYVIVYAALVKTNVLGKDSQGLSAILALCAAIFSLFSPLVVNLITFMIPWLVIMIVVGLMIYIFSEYLGVKAGTKKNEGGEVIINIVIIIVIILFIVGLGKFYNADETSYQGNNIIYQSDRVTVTDLSDGNASSAEKNGSGWLDILFSSEVLGVLLILAIAAYTIRNMGAPR